MTVYLDRVFLLNLLVDYLLLLAAAEFCGRTLRRWRFFLCAALGATYAVAVFLPRCHWLSYPVVRCIAGVILAFAAYLGEAHWYRLAAVFFLLSAGLAGVLVALGLMVGNPTGLLQKVYYANISWPVLIGSTGIFTILLRLFLGQSGRHERGELMKIKVWLNGSVQTITALYDTGHTLRDPVSGKAVLIAEQHAFTWPNDVEKILDEKISVEEKMARLHTCGTQLRFSLLPYKAIGTSCGLLLSVKSDYLLVDGRRYEGTLVALWEGEIADGTGYQALWSGSERRKYRVEETQNPVASSVEKAG